MSEFNLDSLLDGTLDALADLPEFKPFPAGTHKVLITLIDKTAEKDRVNKHPGFELKLKMIETIEQSDMTVEASAPGSETGVLYLLDNEIGQGQFKKLMAAVAAKFGAASVRELAAQVKNVEALVVTKQRQNKDKTQTYTDVVEIEVL